MSPSGAYTVVVGGQPWLTSAPTCITSSSTHSCSNTPSLTLVNVTSALGEDVSGPFNRTAFFYQAHDGTPFIAAIRVVCLPIMCMKPCVC